MKRNRAFRYELKPNVNQKILLAKHAGAARFAFNWGLAQRIQMYEKDKTSTNAIKQHKLLNSLKTTQFPWMYEVSKCAPQEALRDLERAYKNFFRTLNQTQKKGFPKFKKKGFKDSFRLTGAIHLTEKAIQLPRLGKIRLKEQPQVDGKILSATICREADRWFVSITVEQQYELPHPNTGEIVGVDVGLNCFATISNGKKEFAPKPLAKRMKRLKRLSKQHSRKQANSKNCKKSALKLARHHRKTHNIRKDYLHKLTTRLAKTKSAIIVEDLDIKGMLKGPLNRSIHDAGWGEFKRMLEYKTEWYGSKLIKVPRYYPSSKICSQCHSKIDKMPLSIRKWQCQNCQYFHDRDINAAKNLLNFYTGSSPGIYACRDSSDSGTGNCSSSYGSLKQELMNGIFVHEL